MGNAQWIGHILKRLQLVDNSRRKHHVGGKVYAIDRREVLDMMQRYDVPPVGNEGAKQPVKAIRPVNQSARRHDVPDWFDRFDWIDLLF